MRTTSKETIKEEITPSSPVSSVTPLICSVCHQPILPTYYFCPNCGIALTTAPLSTTIGRQIWIYFFSFILPSLCFLFISKWPAVKYVKSTDPKARAIGYVAWIILILSTIFTIWYAIVTTQKIIKATTDSINASIGSLGY